MASSAPPTEAARLRRLRLYIHILLLFASVLCFGFSLMQLVDALAPSLPYRCDMSGQPDSLYELFSSSGVERREDVLGLVVSHHVPTTRGGGNGEGLPPCPKGPWTYREIPTLGPLWTSWWGEGRPGFEKMPVLYGWGRQVYFSGGGPAASAPVEGGVGNKEEGSDLQAASSS